MRDSLIMRVVAIFFLIILIHGLLLSTRQTTAASLVEEPFPCTSAESAPGVYARLIGGLGNQLFIVSAAIMIADELGEKVVLDARQTGTYSYGAAQNVHTRTVFHNPQYFFHSYDYREEGNVFRESDLKRAMKDGFDFGSSRGKGLIVVDPFLSFDYFVERRAFLMEVLKPSSEVQTWVNDAAERLGLVTLDEYYKCGLPPASCDQEIRPLSCKVENCENNVAVQLRLSDKSTPWDFLDEKQLLIVESVIIQFLDAGKRVILFSNDKTRAEEFLSSNFPNRTNIVVSSELHVVEFFMMSQFFGLHILTGSTFQQWALFLSPLHKIRVMVMDNFETPSHVPRRPGGVDDLQFQHTLDGRANSHIVFEPLDANTRLNS